WLESAFPWGRSTKGRLTVLKAGQFVPKVQVAPSYHVCVHFIIDPSTELRTPVRAGPNGADRVLGDKERRVMEIFCNFDGLFVWQFV
ncbi:MAG: hypothetical protein ACYS3S_21280, partial [Planctomycetota bacterium]